MNAFEAGFSGGQTQEHAIIAKSMGIETIIVAINKIDAIGWRKERYEFIQALVITFLMDLGFEEEKIICLPISGVLGENVEKRSKKQELGWYQGPCLIEIIGN